MATSRLIQIPRTNAAADTYILGKVYSAGPKPLDLKFVATEGEEPYAVKLKHDEIDSLRDEDSSCPRAEWERILQSLLLDDDCAAGIEVSAEVRSQKSISVIIKRSVSGIRQTLGSLRLRHRASEDIDIFAWCGAEHLAARCVEAELRELRTANADLARLLDELVAAKDAAETAFAERFCRILNEKKLSIRQQQRLLAVRKEEPEAAAADDGDDDVAIKSESDGGGRRGGLSSSPVAARGRGRGGRGGRGERGAGAARGRRGGAKGATITVARAARTTRSGRKPGARAAAANSDDDPSDDGMDVDRAPPRRSPRAKRKAAAVASESEDEAEQELLTERPEMLDDDDISNRETPSADESTATESEHDSNIGAADRVAVPTRAAVGTRAADEAPSQSQTMRRASAEIAPPSHAPPVARQPRAAAPKATAAAPADSGSDNTASDDEL